MTANPAKSVAAESSARAFLAGFKSAVTSVFFLVLAGTYIGIGALAHGFGFSPLWLALSSIFVWAAPAQVILISSLGGGAALIEVAIAVTLSAIRLFPMVVALLPLLRGPSVRTRHLLLPAHFTSVSMWVESLRLLPTLPREHRVAFCNGLSVGYMGTAVSFGFAGFYLAAGLPPLLAGGLLFLTPMSFMTSTIRNSRQLVDILAFALGLIIGPVLTVTHVSLDLMWTGIAGGTIAYGIHRLRGAAK
ncbi:MAG TPA: AzlC family ABC transporter permease [Pseudolabrys sp.]|nr:AzlC family ABC transporter permease [Pseudolabrys sp.]